MNITLNKLIPALTSLGVDTERINEAITALSCLLTALDDVEVKGRQQVDTLLGCMMAIETIIGKEGENG